MKLKELKALRDGVTPGEWSQEFLTLNGERCISIAPKGGEDDYRVALVFDEAGGPFAANAVAIKLIPTLLDQCIRYREALEHINNPISALRRMAEDEGCKLDGRMVVELTNDPSFYIEIAHQALMVEDSEQ